MKVKNQSVRIPAVANFEKYKLVELNTVMNAIEIDIDSFRAEDRQFQSSLANHIIDFMKNSLHSDKATFYLFQDHGSNLGQSIWSAFLMIGCNKNICLPLYEYLSTSMGIKAIVTAMTNSPYITPYLHYDNGTEHLFFQEDAVSIVINGEEAKISDHKIDEIKFGRLKKSLLGNDSANALSGKAYSKVPIGILVAEIEHRYGLPKGSVALFAPHGYRMDSDQMLGLLRDAWDEY